MSTANRDTEAPILLSSTVNVLENGTANADSGALSAPFRKPIVIDEIRWTASACIDSGVPFSGAGSVNWGGLVRAKLTLGRMNLTKDFVHLWNFGTAINSEFIIDPIIGGASAQVRYSMAHFRWKLPKPLYIPQGQTLTCQIARDANLGPWVLIDGTGVRVDISYAGRYLKPNAEIPAVLEVPYVTTYVPPPDVTTHHSDEKDLVNPFLVPYNVQRMIGRLRFYNQSISVAGDVIDRPFSALSAPTIQIKDSYGYTVLRDFTNISDVFQYPRRAWTFHRILEPKERYHVAVRNMRQDIPPSKFLPMISMVGWREEVMR